MPKLIDLTDKRFGKLTVISRADNDNQGHPKWLCKCDCGNTTIVRASSIKLGRTTSCGCVRKTTTSEQAQKNTTHGMTKSRLYKIWDGIKYRCCNLSSPAYRHYGGRGITICDEWKNDFVAFRDWALDNGYSDNLTIDRIDVNGNYEPSNCRWVTMKVQHNNRRNNHLVEFNGQTKTVSQWADEYKIDAAALFYRLKIGWSIEKALLHLPRH